VDKAVAVAVVAAAGTDGHKYHTPPSPDDR